MCAGILLVLDGGKGLKAAAKDVFGELGLVQRRRIHYAEQRIMPSWRPGALRDKDCVLMQSA